MHLADDPFLALAAREGEAADSGFDASCPPGTMPARLTRAPALGALRGFDLLGQPLVGELVACPGEVVASRSTVVLRHAQVGRQVLVVYADGDARAPVIVGVIEPHPLQPQSDAAPVQPGATLQVDGERRVIEAEREIVLRCGDASITLTRAGKVLIQGRYVSSRSAGYNKIKGAAVEIN